MKKLTLICLIVLQEIIFCQINFTRITDQNNPVVKLKSTVVYRGAAWVDIDNNNKIDLFVCPWNLFRNDGTGNFSVVTNPIGVGQTQNPCGVTWGDYNNDGYIDCFLARNPSTLYLNDGNGNFTADANVFNNPQNYPGWGCSFGDFNNDGKLDLFIAHPAGFIGTPYPSFFLISDTDNKLNLDTSYLFSKQLGPYTVPYWCDFDQDGDLDLFIASGPGGTPGPDYLYKNLKMETGKDTLVRITDLPFATEMQDGQCYNFIDYDNDGDLDLCITNWRGAPNRFYKNNNGTYQEIPVPFNYNSSSLGNTWGDLDNDGYLDLIITNDQYKNTEIYRNNGDGTFTLASTAVSSLIGSACAVLGDYDNDGDLDLFVSGNTAGMGLFRNEAQQNHNNWVNITCVGTFSNRSAIGAKVKLKAVINGKSMWQYREISAQNTFQGMNDLRVHFGLGNAAIIDSMIIIYPGGHTETFQNVQPNKFYRNTEGSGSLEPITSIKPENKGIILPAEYKLYQNYPNPFNPSTTIKYSLSRSSLVNINVYDITGKLIEELINKTQSEGEYTLEFDGKGLTSGTYFFVLKAGNYTDSKGMILLK